MRKSNWMPSIVPGEDQNVCLVMDDLGELGRVWRKTAELANLETVIADLLDGQYKNPLRVVAFNTADKWALDISVDVARELRRLCDLQQRDLPTGIQDFVERNEITTLHAV